MAHNLGELEVLILTAVKILGNNAYGVTIYDEVLELAGGTRSVSLGSMYTTLHRLEEKGHVESWSGDPTPERGGRAKRFYNITKSGKAALDNSLRLAENVAAALRIARFFPVPSRAGRR